MLKKTEFYHSACGARCSSVVERPLMVRWFVGSIHHGEPIQLFLVSASAPWLMQERLWYLLSYLCDDACKRTLVANRKE